MPKATSLTYTVSIQATLQTWLAKQYIRQYRCTLGSVEALARTDARSDHAVLDFLVTFFIKKKGKNKNYMSVSMLKSFTTKKPFLN